MAATTVYTDGACKGNPGPGGWAWIVPDGPWASGAEADSTNQRMEVAAVLDAVSTIDGPLDIASDSTYVVNCFRDGWWEGWLKRGWKNSAKKPVANRDLWEPLIERYRPRAGEISFRWVKGHSGDRYNDLADALAVEAALLQEGRTGTGAPEISDPADLPTSDRANSAWRPGGRSLAVFGVQPPQLGGYDDNPVADGVREKLREILKAKSQLDPDLVVMSGLRLGAETLAVEAAVEAGVPYVAVLPYPDPESRWPTARQERFRFLVDGAAHIIQLEKKVPASPAQAGQALDRRNGWLRKVADEMLVVWDHDDGRIGKLVADLERERPDDLWIVDV